MGTISNGYVRVNKGSSDYSPISLNANKTILIHEFNLRKKKYAFGR